jgi:hypothetical protein
MSDPQPGTPEWKQIKEEREKWEKLIKKMQKEWPTIPTPPEPTTTDLAAKVDACCATIGEIHTIVLSIDRQLTQLTTQLREEE